MVIRLLLAHGARFEATRRSHETSHRLEQDLPAGDLGGPAKGVDAPTSVSLRGVPSGCERSKTIAGKLHDFRDHLGEFADCDLRADPTLIVLSEKCTIK